MRRSPLRHPLAVLRQTIGLTQKELAALLKCSRQAVQAIELDELPLSERTAANIARVTGVNAMWLAAGNPKAPIEDMLGKPYTLDTFARTQANVNGPIPHVDATHALIYLWLGGLLATILGAIESGERSLCYLKVSKTLEQLRKEFRPHRGLLHEVVNRFPRGGPVRPRDFKLFLDEYHRAFDDVVAKVNAKAAKRRAR
jgi:transcriptional regulator with XRE-family HTH domain